MCMLLSNRREKIDTLVDFPLRLTPDIIAIHAALSDKIMLHCRGLDMTPYVRSCAGQANPEPLLYDCYAISVGLLPHQPLCVVCRAVTHSLSMLCCLQNHSGSLSYGHYTAFAFCNDRWYLFDDRT